MIYFIIAVSAIFVILVLVLIHFHKKEVEKIRQGQDVEIPESKKKSSKIWSGIGYGLIGVLGILLITNLSMQYLPFSNRVLAVVSESMSYKNEENEYLFENDLNNQIQKNDLIFVKKVDDISQIKLYDIVCYKHPDGRKIIHRVIKLTEDYFVTQGDANSDNDHMMLTNDDLIGVYTGTRIPYVGAIVLFFNSTLGILTIVYLIVLAIIDGYLNGRLQKERVKEALMKEGEVDER